MSNKVFGTIISNSGTITIFTKSKTHMIGTDHIRYKAIIEAIKMGNTSNIEELIDLTVNIKKAMKNTFNTDVSIKNGVVPEQLDKPLYKSNGYEIDADKDVEQEIEKLDKKIVKNYHNVRDANGHFIKKSVQVSQKVAVYSFKPNGQKYFSVRGNGGKFTKVK